MCVEGQPDQYRERDCFLHYAMSWEPERAMVGMLGSTQRHGGTEQAKHQGSPACVSFRLLSVVPPSHPRKEEP